MLRRSGFKRKVYEPAPRPPVTPSVRRWVIRQVGDVVVAVPKEIILRSEPYRRFVASQECFACRLVGWSQCAHENVGKGLGLKVCDSRTFPACGPHHGLIGCHQQFDLGVDCGRDERRELGAKYVAEMQARAIGAGWRFTSEAIVAP